MILTSGRTAHGAGDAACEPAAAEGNEHRLDIRPLLQDLDADGGIAGERGRVAHRVDVDAGLALERPGFDRPPPFIVGDACRCAFPAPQLFELRLRRVRRARSPWRAIPRRRAIQATPSALLPELVV